MFWVSIFIGLVLASVQVASSWTGEKPSDVIINEFLASNGSGLVDEDGEYSDWIELYNPSDAAINLSGWSLTDDPGQPGKWPFPDITLPGKGYLVVFASGKDRTGADTELHTNFRLDKEGEFLALYNILDQLWMEAASSQFQEQFRDTSYGRYGDGLVYGYLGRPTPGEPNDETLIWEGAVSPVEFSVERGFYEAPFALALNTDTSGATIHYTTDGSQPTETDGVLYTGPIQVNTTSLVRTVAFRPKYRSSYVVTHTYIFLEDVLVQPSAPPGFPATWGTHSVDFAEYAKGSPVMADYEMDPQVVDELRYRSMIKDGLESIPTLSLVMDISSFDELYSHPRDRGTTWERPVSVELIYPGASRDGFQIDAGIRMHGGVGRLEFIPKHSFRLLFKRKYGPGKLEYPLFPDSPVEEFDTLVLRSESDRGFAGTGSIRRKATYVRDEWLRASQIATSGVGAHGLYVHLYIDGLYWGLYNLVERPDASFMASYFGGSEEEWYVANQDGPLERDVADWAEELQNLVIQIGHVGRDTDRIENDEVYAERTYAAIEPYIDTTQFIDYIILHWYAGVKDWPQNNWYAGVNPSGQLQFFVWDGQESWSEGARIHLGRTDTSRLNVIKPIFEILWHNPDFRMQLADRMYKHLFNDGVLTDANSQARWKKTSNTIDRAIVGESARWGDVRSHSNPITRDDWLKAQDDVLAQMDGNAARLIDLAREAGYYPAIDAPTFSQDGGLVPTGFNLTMSASFGTIYYTTDGSDPRLPGDGAIAPSAIINRSPLVLTTTTHVQARVWDGDTWSALHEAMFKLH